MKEFKDFTVFNSLDIPVTVSPAAAGGDRAQGRFHGSTAASVPLKSCNTYPDDLSFPDPLRYTAFLSWNCFSPFPTDGLPTKEQPLELLKPSGVNHISPVYMCALSLALALSPPGAGVQWIAGSPQTHWLARRGFPLLLLKETRQTVACVYRRTHMLAWFRPCLGSFSWVQAYKGPGLGLGPRIRKQMVLKVSPGDLLTANGAFPLVHSPSLSVSLPLFPPPC
ncbi:hypothetical protein QQF64_032826 [Cirrhinus molitorella]|uniref:Uncharacterized protein n=1 Tax=Cirrhinus molitorella TaxID=172907 RepID=A0ABR3MS51_9TELE